MKDLIQVTRRGSIKLQPGLGEAVVYVVLWPNWLSFRNPDGFRSFLGWMVIWFFLLFLRGVIIEDTISGVFNYIFFGGYLCWFSAIQEEAEADLLVKLIKKRAGK